MMNNIFLKEEADAIVARIRKLSPSQQRQWGKMTVDQMLAHCNVPYAYTYEPEQFKRPGAIRKFILQHLVKKYVVNEQPYKQGGRTAPEFVINNNRNFEKEQALLISNIQKTQALGAAYFEGRAHFSFGKMTAAEWNNMFYKHLDHHLRQFGV